MSQPALFRGLYPSIRQVKATMPEKPFTAQQLQQAAQMRRTVYNGCPHEPRCAVYARCVEEIAWYLRQQGR
jgi:hypothetical protein